MARYRDCKLSVSVFAVNVANIARERQASVIDKHYERHYCGNNHPYHEHTEFMVLGRYRHANIINLDSPSNPKV